MSSSKNKEFIIIIIIIIIIVKYQSAQERLFTVQVLNAFHFSWPIFVFTIHIFPSEYNYNQSVNMLQRLPHNLTVARLLH